MTAVVKDAAYWRDLAASAATIEMALITTLSPEGFAEAMGGNRWYHVDLGPLSLGVDGSWLWRERGESLEERVKYAFRSAEDALRALRAEVAPDEPACAKIVERFFFEK